VVLGLRIRAEEADPAIEILVADRQAEHARVEVAHLSEVLAIEADVTQSRDLRHGCPPRSVVVEAGVLSRSGSPGVSSSRDHRRMLSIESGNSHSECGASDADSSTPASHTLRRRRTGPRPATGDCSPAGFRPGLTTSRGRPEISGARTGRAARSTPEAIPKSTVLARAWRALRVADPVWPRACRWMGAQPWPVGQAQENVKRGITP
jgi:hypothetical protein